eukprot:3750727-Rhodomonas_salina.2
MDRFVGAEGLRELLDNGDVKLLRAKWLLENEHWQVLKTVNRQQLEELHPEAFVDEVRGSARYGEKVGDGGSRCSQERQLGAKVLLCGDSGGLVLLANTNAPGSLRVDDGYAITTFAVRSKYSRGRLYLDWKVAGLQLKDYSWDFGVLVDFWSLFQVAFAACMLALCGGAVLTQPVMVPVCSFRARQSRRRASNVRRQR